LAVAAHVIGELLDHLASQAWKVKTGCLEIEVGKENKVALLQ